MDYDSMDLEMSCWVVTAKRQGTVFFLTDQGLATDILGQARLYRYYGVAEAAADEARQEKEWRHFHWVPMSYPAAFARAVKVRT